MRRALATALVAALLLAGAARSEPFRIGVPAAATAPCAPAKGVPPAEQAYDDHLAKRLQRPVLRCPFATSADAAAALARGEVDMARLDPAAYGPVASQVRAILTVRREGESNRLPVYVAVRGADPAEDVAALKGRRIAFAGRSPAAYATPQAVLADHGLPSGAYRAVVADGDAALADLRAGRVEAAAVHAAAWQRVCRMVSPKDPDPCRDLRAVLHARPRAAWALVVRRDMPAELRYRLIGIHLPLRLEAPAAFAFAAGPGAAEFQPAEAEALTTATLE